MDTLPKIPDHITTGDEYLKWKYEVQGGWKGQLWRAIKDFFSEAKASIPLVGEGVLDLAEFTARTYNVHPEQVAERKEKEKVSRPK